MEHMGRLAILGASFFVLVGCASAAPAAPVETSPPVSAACYSTATHTDCTRVLTNVATGAYDSYRAIQSPTAGQDQAYNEINTLSGDWSRECMDKSAPARVGDDLVCFALVERISTAALAIDETLDD